MPTDEDYKNDPDYIAFNKQREEDLHLISLAMNDKETYGLGVEILYSAFESIRYHPEKTITDAIQDGFDDWVK